VDGRSPDRIAPNDAKRARLSTLVYHDGEDLGNPAMARLAKRFGYTLDALRKLL
jgi:hypothetical protein